MNFLPFDMRGLPLLAAAFFLAVSHGMVSAVTFEKLPESIDAEAKRLAVVFDFETDSCYPSPAVSGAGKVNEGSVPSGSITSGCRDKSQLTGSNTYHRKKSMTRDGITYSVHMYALYFKKDQIASYVGGGHRHDWEFALVWTTGGVITHASYSAHGKVYTQPKDELFFDPGMDEAVKVVYHKDPLNTHAFRFARRDEAAVNHSKKWITPTLVDWETMKSDSLGNPQLRKILNDARFGAAICPFNQSQFQRQIKKNPPPAYPL